MFRPSFLALTVFGLLFALPAQANPARMQPGLWQIAVSGQGGMAINLQQCLTQKQIDENGGLPPESQKDNPCKRTSVKMEGNKMSWTVACSGEFQATGAGEMTLSPTQYNGRQTVTIAMQGQKITQENTFSGKRISDCKP
jgi:Protein of unknown function (DUF3617)